MPLSELTQRSLESTWAAEAERASHELSSILIGQAASLNAKGLFRSGAHVKAIDQVAAQTLSTVANRMFDTLVEANDSEDPRSVEDRILVLQGLFADRLNRYCARLEAVVHAAVDKLGVMTEDRHRSIRVQHLLLALEYERNRLVERTRFVVTASAKKGTPMGNTVHISGGNVASIAVGDFAHSQGHQEIVAGVDLSTVIEALGIVIERVGISTVGSPSDREQVARMLDEVRNEAGRQAPDKWRVSGLADSAGKFVKFLPDAQKAWDIVQGWVAALLNQAK